MASYVFVCKALSNKVKAPSESNRADWCEGQVYGFIFGFPTKAEATEWAGKDAEFREVTTLKELRGYGFTAWDVRNHIQQWASTRSILDDGTIRHFGEG